VIVSKISFFKSDFAKNIFTLVSATALAQVINFGFNVFLTRIYTPASFGALSIFTSLVGFILVVASGKYDIALVVATDRDEAKGLLTVGTWLTFISALVCLIASWVIYMVPIHFYDQSVVRNWLYLIPVAVIFLSLFQLFWMWNVREKKFKTVSFIRPLEAFINNGLCILLKGYQATGLLLGSLAGQFVSMLLITGISLQGEGIGLFAHHIKKLKTLSVKYAEFPRINILQGIIDTLQISILVLIASAYFPAAEIGYYALCMRILQVPMRLIVLPFSHVFFAEASEALRDGRDLYQLVKRSTYQIGIWTVALPIVLITGGAFIFKLIFGAEWYTAGIYAGVLSPWIFLDIIRAPIAQVASILGRQKQILFLSVLSSAILLITVVTNVALHSSFVILLSCVSATQCLMTALIIFTIFKMAKKAAPTKA